MQCSSPYLLWKTPVWHLKVVAARRWGLGRVAIPVSMDWFPLYFMGKSMVSCRFSLEKIHWLLILTSLDRLFTLEASCGVVTVARCQRNDMEYNSYYRLSRNGVPKADFFHVSRMYNHQIDSISLFTSAQESPPPVNYTSNNHFNELTQLPVKFGGLQTSPFIGAIQSIQWYFVPASILSPIERFHIYICILMG